MGERNNISAGVAAGGTYCRRCDYDLRASEHRCPECGRPFDPANPKTFRRKPHSAFRPWARWMLAVLMLALIPAGTVGWLWRGWRAEEKEVQWLRKSGDATVKARPAAYPLLEAMLPGRLKYLTERVTKVSVRGGAKDAGLAHLAGMKQIVELDARCTFGAVTDPGLAQLEGIRQMQVLNLKATHVTDAGLAHLAGMTQLQELDIGYNRLITDAGLAHLAGMTRMQKLRLNETGITDRGLACLAGMAQLRELDLNYTGITDAGLAQLSGMTRLQALNLHLTRVTDAGVEKLRAALPKARVER